METVLGKQSKKCPHLLMAIVCTRQSQLGPATLVISLDIGAVD